MTPQEKKVQEQRDQMIRDLATILEWQRTHEAISKERADDNEIEHSEIKALLIAQNGRVRVNSGKINWIMGVGSAVAFILSLGLLQVIF